MSCEQLVRWLAVNNARGLGPRRIFSLHKQSPDLDILFNGNVITAAGLAGITPASMQRIIDGIDFDSAALLLEKCRQLEIQVVSLESREYPSLLRQIADPPPVLFYRGKLPLPQQLLLAVVGSRKATAYGKQVTAGFAKGLALAGVGVVSGLALGIDAQAHRRCLDYGGYTVAVLGCGTDVVYPASHRELYNDIATKGCLVSEFPPGTPPHSNNFPRRNRIISGLCRGVVVVEAAIKSGAMITVGYALEQGRDVYAVPGNITSPASAGCNQLIDQGARPALHVNQIIHDCGLVAVASESSPEGRGGMEQEILEKIDGQGVSLDELSHSTGLPGSVLLAHLVTLELQGLILRLPGQKYARIGGTEG